MPHHVADLMSRSVVTVTEETKFHEIAAIMRGYGVSAVPVLDASGRAIGMVSHTDLLLKFGPPTGWWRHGEGFPYTREERRKAHAITAAGLMTSPAITIGPRATVTEAATRMRRHRVKRLPVTDEEGRLLGLVSRADLMTVYSRPDTDIMAEVRRKLITRFDLRSVRVAVEHGIVLVTGRVRFRSTIFELIRAIRHVEGVIRVESWLDYDVDDLFPLSREAFSPRHPVA